MVRCVVYHKRLEGMGLDEGYIGVSTRYEKRQEEHEREAHARGSIYTLYQQMREHQSNVLTDIILDSDVPTCYDYEQELRPRWHMGWNMAIGGGRPGSGWRPGKNWLDNRLWHPQYGEERISSSNTCNAIAERYNLFSSGFSNLLRGAASSHKGWELADAQLAERVRNRYHRPWEFAYLMNGTDIVKLNKSGHGKFISHYELGKSIRMKKVITNSQSKLMGWELATEQEWLSTTERLEFV